MQDIFLKTKNERGQKISAQFLPGLGMTLVSFQIDGIEIIDQETKKAFDERRSGLGVLIGPHFYRRNPATLPFIENKERFPFMQKLKEAGSQDPFSHGIGRYAPWNYSQDGNAFEATLSGEDVWEGSLLKDLEGQNFKMTFLGELHSQGLSLKLSVVSDTSSIVGIHYYYRLPRGKGVIYSKVQDKTIENSQKRELPESWKVDDEQNLMYSLDRDTDHTLYPFPNPLHGDILLKTEEYSLRTCYNAPSEESSWQLYHPKGSGFVCIEPNSAQNPRAVNLTASSISIDLIPET